MEGWLQTAGLVLKTIAVESGLLDPAGKRGSAQLGRARLGWMESGWERACVCRRPCFASTAVALLHSVCTPGLQDCLKAASTKAAAFGAFAELGAVDESLRSRMAEWFPGEQLPPLQKVIVELDSRFLTELTHTAAMYAQLFEPGGRKRLVKVWAGRMQGSAPGRAAGGCLGREAFGWGGCVVERQVLE